MPTCLRVENTCFYVPEGGEHVFFPDQVCDPRGEDGDEQLQDVTQRGQQPGQTQVKSGVYTSYKLLILTFWTMTAILYLQEGNKNRKNLDFFKRSGSGQISGQF